MADGDGSDEESNDVKYNVVPVLEHCSFQGAEVRRSQT